MVQFRCVLSVCSHVFSPVKGRVCFLSSPRGGFKEWTASHVFFYLADIEE